MAKRAEFIAAMDSRPVHLLGHARDGCVAFQWAQAHFVKTLIPADPGSPLHQYC